MKNLKALLLSLITILTFNTAWSQNKKKVAVVTFYVDRNINFSDFDGLVKTGTSLATLNDDPNFDLQPILENFHDVFFDKYVSLFPFEIAKEQEVITNANYQNYVSKSGESLDNGSYFFSSLLPYEGYKPLYITTNEVYKREDRNHSKMIEIFGKQYDGIIFVAMSFEVEKSGSSPILGFSNAHVRAYAHIKMWNNKGERIFNIHEYAKSKKPIKLFKGIPLTKSDKLIPMCQNASERLYKDLLRKLPRTIKKVERRF